MQIIYKSITKITSALIIAISCTSQLGYAQYETISMLSCWSSDPHRKFGSFLIDVNEKGDFIAASLDTDYKFASKLKYVHEGEGKFGEPFLWIVAEDETMVVVGLQEVEKLSKEAGGGYGSYSAWYVPESGAYGAISLGACIWKD